MSQVSLKDANKAYFATLRVPRARASERPDDAEPGGQRQGAGPSDEQVHRAELMDAIEKITGKRPGANTKTETLEQRMAEIQAGSQDGEQPQE